MKHCLFFYAFAFACMFLGSCGESGLISPFLSVTLKLPEPTPALVALFSEEHDTVEYEWKIVWFDACGTRNESTQSGKTARIMLERGCFTPILLYSRARTTGGNAFEMRVPAGAIYPNDGSSDARQTATGCMTIEPDWIGGLAAECARDVCLSSSVGFFAGKFIAERFNWTRFREQVAKMTDPGALDREKLIKAILSGSVTVYAVTNRKITDIELDFSGRDIAPGTTLFPEQPLSPVCIWPEGGKPILPLSDGQCRFFRPDEILTLETVGGKLRCGFFSSYVLQD